MKCVQVNGKDVGYTHKVVTDHHHITRVELTLTLGDLSSTHHLTIGPSDGPLPDGYDEIALQKDLEVFRQRHAAILEGKYRAKMLAAKIVEDLDA